MRLSVCDPFLVASSAKLLATATTRLHRYRIHFLRHTPLLRVVGIGRYALRRAAESTTLRTLASQDAQVRLEGIRTMFGHSL